MNYIFIVYEQLHDPAFYTNDDKQGTNEMKFHFYNN